MTIFIDRNKKEFELIYSDFDANSTDRIKPYTKISMLTVNKYLGYYKNNPNEYKKRHVYQVTCDCGTVKMVKEDELKRTLSGKRKIFSCGCYNKEFIKNHRRDMSTNPWFKNKYHSEKDKKLIKHYRQIKRRCNDVKSIEYKNYGGRGIKLCDQWANDKGIDNFGDWMIQEAGFNYNMGREVSLNRANNEKDYSPNNCYLSYQTEQANNTTKNTYIDWYGQRFSLSELSRYFGINYSRVENLYYENKTIHEALFSPVFKSRYERKEIIDNSPNGLVIIPKAFILEPFQFVDYSTVSYRDPRREYSHPNHNHALYIMDFQNKETLKEQGTPVQPFRFTNSGSTDFLLYGKYQN